VVAAVVVDLCHIAAARRRIAVRLGYPRNEELMLHEKREPDTVPADSSSSPSLEISNAMARLHKQYIGRGPTNSRTTIDGDLVVCLLEGGYTRAEQTLEENNKGDLVAAARLGLQDAMSDAMVAVVEQTLGRTVRSFMSANDLNKNLQVEVFVLTAVDNGAGTADSEALAAGADGIAPTTG
jgi:uncharacterized protein YbcI